LGFPQYGHGVSGYCHRNGTTHFRPQRPSPASIQLSMLKLIDLSCPACRHALVLNPPNASNRKILSPDSLRKVFIFPTDEWFRAFTKTLSRHVILRAAGKSGVASVQFLLHPYYLHLPLRQIRYFPPSPCSVPSRVLDGWLNRFAYATTYRFAHDRKRKSSDHVLSQHPESESPRSFR
jgi:hypothetical protein